MATTTETLDLPLSLQAAHRLLAEAGGRVAGFDASGPAPDQLAWRHRSPQGVLDGSAVVVRAALQPVGAVRTRVTFTAEFTGVLNLPVIDLDGSLWHALQAFVGAVREALAERAVDPPVEAPPAPGQPPAGARPELDASPAPEVAPDDQDDALAAAIHAHLAHHGSSAALARAADRAAEAAEAAAHAATERLILTGSPDDLAAVQRWRAEAAAHRAEAAAWRRVDGTA